MKVYVFTRIPPRQGLLGTIPEKITLDETEADNLEEVADKVHVPQGGHVYIIAAPDATVITTKVVRERLELT